MARSQKDIQAEIAAKQDEVTLAKKQVSDGAKRVRELEGEVAELKDELLDSLLNASKQK